MPSNDALPPNSYPLAVAARFLGLSTDALRMRIRRGRAKGFKKGGRLFAVLDPEELMMESAAILQASDDQRGRLQSAAVLEPGGRITGSAQSSAADALGPSDLAARIKELESHAKRDREILSALHRRLMALESRLSPTSPGSAAAGSNVGSGAGLGAGQSGTAPNKGRVEGAEGAEGDGGDGDGEELLLIPDDTAPAQPAAAPRADAGSQRTELIARLSNLGLKPEERRAAAEIVNFLLKGEAGPGKKV